MQGLAARDGSGTNKGGERRVGGLQRSLLHDISPHMGCKARLCGCHWSSPELCILPGRLRATQFRSFPTPTQWGRSLKQQGLLCAERVAHTYCVGLCGSNLG